MRVWPGDFTCYRRKRLADSQRMRLDQELRLGRWMDTSRFSSRDQEHPAFWYWAKAWNTMKSKLAHP